MQGITGSHMLDGLEKCRNVAAQKTPPIPISSVEDDCVEECDLVDK